MDENTPKYNIPMMMAKLDELYEKEEKLLREMEKLRIVYDQLQEDKEMLQNFIMYQSNKNLRESQKNTDTGSILDRIRRM